MPEPADGARAAQIAGDGSKRCFRNAGQIYYGEVIESEAGDAVRHGFGRHLVTATTVNGASVTLGRYEGAWRQGKMTGTGVYRWMDGSVYSGFFVDGRPHGHGELKWSEGSEYDGAWRDGEMDGQGRFYDAFNGIAVQGFFKRNCFRRHDGTWTDMRAQRERHRSSWLHIGAVGLSPEAKTRVTLRCAPDALASHVAAALSDNLVPFVLPGAGCPASNPGSSDCKGSRQGQAPMWCLEGDAFEGQGCTPETTVHVSYVAAERRRNRDHSDIFREALCKALMTCRPFALVFGDGGANPQDGESPPPSWQLPTHLGESSLPPDLFDLMHFHASGAAERFLPAEKRAAATKASTATAAPALPPVVATPDPGEQGGEPGEEAAVPTIPPTAPPLVYLLRFVLVSLRRLPPGAGPEDVRTHLAKRFGEHVPLHRVAAIVVDEP